MSWGRWVEGCVVVVAVFVPIFLGAHAVRRRLVPDWPAEPGALADLVLTFSAVIVVGEIVGTLHLFAPFPLALAAIAAGVALHRASRLLPAPDVREHEPVRGRLGSRTEIGLGFVALLGLAAQSLDSIVDVWRGGLYDYDSLHYHLTLAARFVTDGSTTGIPVIGQDASAYYPANAELLHAIGLSGFRVEVFSPIVNLAAIGLFLLAAAALGALVHRTAAAVAVAAAVLTLPVFGIIGAGALSNDIFAMAGFLAFVALAAWCLRDPVIPGFAVLLLPGLAAGLAAGTKLTVAAPLALVAAAVVGSQRSWRAAGRVAAALVGGVLVTAGYWLVRNAIAVHNPTPELALGVGPLRLPAPRFDVVEATSQNVLHYVADRRVIRRFYIPGLDFALGRAWPIVLALAAAAAIALILRGSRFWRLIGLAGVLAVLAYLVTPTTAGGAEGFPFLFRFNLRYVGPALVLLVVAALVLPVISRLASWWAAAFVLVELIGLGRGSAWAAPDRRVAVVLVTVVAASAVVAAVAAARRVPRGFAWCALAVVVIAAFVGGGIQARHYVSTARYARPVAPRDELLALGRNRTGVTAVTGLPLLASFYGPRLDGRVVFLHQIAARREVVPPQTCAAFRDQLAAQHADLLVIVRTASGVALPTEAWAASISDARLVLANDAGAAYTLPRDVTTAGCT